jgi:DNA-binding transcriptional ArsR family regulator
MSRPLASESVFRAIADPTRRRIMDLLRGREATPADLNQTLRIAGGVLTFHLRALLQAGVVSQRRRGRQRMYRLNAQVLSPVAQWMRSHESRA